MGVALVCTVAAVPMLVERPTKPGHGLFDSEKPQEVELAQEARRREELGVVGTRTRV